MKRLILAGLVGVVAAATPGISVQAQPPGGFGPGGPGMRGPGGPGGFGGPNREERKLLEQFDQNKNGWLESDERVAARKEATSQQETRGRRFGGPPGGPGGRGPGGRGPRGPRSGEPGKPGPKISAGEVATYPDKALYDPAIVRTLFLEFENEDWEVELEDFHGTDVDVPATLSVDGQSYPNVGVHFRGASSYGMVPRGSKRSFNVSLDLADEEQRLYGYKTLNLLNGNGDPSMMSTVLYSEIARQYLAAPKANFVHVVVNGESWGLYVNVQQFDKTFVKENFDGSKGTRWKVSGNPGADGGLRYLGDDLEEYKARFEMKSNDGKKAWNALVNLCKVLNETPLDQLQAELDPILDIDGTLKFLALDNALVNSDGYWTRASDYSLFLDFAGKFHIIPHDMNEAFALAGHGPPGFRGRGGFGPGGPGDREPRGRRGFGGRPPLEDPPEGDGAEARPPRDRPAEGRRGEERGLEGRGERQQGPPRDFGFGPPPGFGGPGFGPPPGGPGGPGGPGFGPPPGFGGPGRGFPGHGGTDLDPLVGLDNERMPLRSRLLAIPELRDRYMAYVKQIAEQSLDWQQLRPTVQAYRELVDPVIKIDTRKLDTYEGFLAATETSDKVGEQMSLQKFAKERREYLLKDAQE